MKTYTAEGKFDTSAKSYAVRFKFNVLPGRAQTYGQPAEDPRIGDKIRAWLCMDGMWHLCDGLLHDMIVADDLTLDEWLLEQAAESEQASAEEAADHRRELNQEQST